MQSEAVLIRIDGHSGYIQFVGGTKHTDGDLAFLTPPPDLEVTGAGLEEAFLDLVDDPAKLENAA